MLRRFARVQEGVALGGARLALLIELGAPRSILLCAPAARSFSRCASAASNSCLAASSAACCMSWSARYWLSRCCVPTPRSIALRVPADISPSGGWYGVVGMWKEALLLPPLELSAAGAASD